MVKLKLTFLCLVFSFVNLYSQKILKGQILNSVNKEPVAYANISIINSSIGTVSNLDGEFVINIPKEKEKTSLIVSHIGYRNETINVSFFKSKILLLPTSIELEEVNLLIGKKRLNGNEIVKKAFENYSENFPDKPFLAKGFLRHIEKNKKEYKWLIEAGITFFDNAKRAEEAEIKFNIDEERKSYDNRSIDSLNLYLKYLIKNKGKGYGIIRKKERIRDTVSDGELVKGVMYNDQESSGLSKIFNGHKNIIINKYNFDNGNQDIIRNYGNKEAIFDKNIFKKHEFSLDSIFLEGDRYVYKIKINPNPKMINLNKVLKKDYAPIGWIFIYKDNFAIKEIEYILVAASKNSKLRNHLLYDTPVHYKVNLKYVEHNGKMYLNYFSCNLPKNLGYIRGLGKEDYYYTKQEILFTEIITNQEEINKLTINKKWNNNLFISRSYNEDFWENKTILLENKEEKKMILDLEKKLSLKKQFKKKM